MALTYPQIDPILVSIGPLAIRWYGLMYLVGFGCAWLLGRYSVKQHPTWTEQQLSDLIFYGALGVILGGRIGYMLFYSFQQFLEQPWIIFRVWEGGMSFHGGLIGVALVIIWFSRVYHKPLFDVADFTAPLVPLGIAAGRIANFINGELWGRPTDLPWGMVFPHVDNLPRHPSQLYECGLEGFVLFFICWWFSRISRPPMTVTGVFLLCYGLLRWFLEFFREPDMQLGFVAFDWLTMGQLLSIPMIIAGSVLLYCGYCNRKESLT